MRTPPERPPPDGGQARRAERRRQTTRRRHCWSRAPRVSLVLQGPGSRGTAMAEHGDIGHESIQTLLELQHRWHAALSDRVEEYVEAAASDEKQEAVRAAYRNTASEHRALRVVLDEFAHHPALALPRRWEHIMLADAAGVRGP